MRGFLLVLLMSYTYVKHITSCPTSCVVCSEDTIICHKLSNIIGVPETTKVLMLTDGQIDSLDRGNFSDLSNMTMLGLSNNAIANITESAFQNLVVLRVLLLDHNLISSSSIFSSTFSQLQNLEILRLGNNAIQAIDGGWFHGMKTLLTLQLEGNLITRLESTTFQAANLENLETLDLSDNLIEHVDRGSFRALPRLRTLDLSRNNLHTAPDAFSYLSWLSALNLDYNQWNCTCELQELSSFLSSYMQAPDKVLYNGRQMVCLNAANPAVQTVLQLTEANCVPPNENITVVIAARGSISARQYARDVSLAAIFFFAGGVGLTVGVLYIFYSKLELRKALNAWRDRSLDDEGGLQLGGAIQNQGFPEWSFTGDSKTQVLSITHPGQETKLMSANSMVPSNQRPWLRDVVPSGVRSAVPKHHFVCHHCSPDGQNQRRQGRRSSFNRQEDVLYHYMDSEHFTGRKEPLSHIRSSPSSHRNAPTPYSATHGEEQTSRTHWDFGGSYSHHNGHSQTIQTMPDYLTIHCTRCLKTHEYRQAGSTVRTAKVDATNEGTLETRYRWKELSESNAQPPREIGLNDAENHTGVDGYGRQPHARNPGMNIPLERSVTFNLTGSDAHMITASLKKSLKDKGHKVNSSDIQKRKEKHRRHKEKVSKSNQHEKGDHLKRHKQRVQSRGLLKVKLNLNPFRKNRVRPKEHLNEEDMLSAQERVGTMTKKSKLSSKDKKIHLKHSRDNHAVSETKKKSSKVSKTDRADHAKKPNQSTSTKQAHDPAKQRVKSSRPKAFRKNDKLKHTEQESCDYKGREYDANLVKEENSLSLSQSSKRSKRDSLETDRSRNSQEHSPELEEKRQPPTVNVIHKTLVKEDSVDGARTLELKAEDSLASGGVPVLPERPCKEVSNEDQPTNPQLKEKEEPPFVRGGTSSATEMSRTDVTEKHLRPVPDSSMLQAEVQSPDTNAAQEAQHSHMLDLGDALVEQKPQLHTENGNTVSVHEEGPSVIQEQAAFTADVTGRELPNTGSVEGGTSGPVRPTLGGQDEQHISEMDLGQKALSNHGGTDMQPNQELESKFVESLTVEGELKKESNATLDSLKGDNSDMAMMEVLGTGPQTSAELALPQSHSTEPLAHAEMGLSLLTDSLAAPDSQPFPDISDQMAMAGSGPTNPLDVENLSNNNSIKPESSHPIILQEYLPPSDGSPKRKLRLIIPERPRNRPVTPLDKKIR